MTEEQVTVGQFEETLRCMRERDEKMILEHEIMEAFLYRRKRVFDPHNTVGELSLLQVGKRG